jgi:predicted peptidase
MNNQLLSVLGGLFSAGFSSDKEAEQGEILSRITQVEAKNYSYQVYLPPQAKFAGKLPVIVFLHGIRERGSGGFLSTTSGISILMKQFMKQIPAIVLFPQCRPESYWSDPSMDKMVSQALAQTVEEFSADEKRIYLIGVSMGGYGVWHFASEYPGKFAAFVSICGGSSILSGDRFSPIAQKTGKTPAWLFHGAEDRVVPVGESRELFKALKENHGNVKYSEYPGVGHNVWMNVLSEKELLPWLLAQRLE